MKFKRNHQAEAMSRASGAMEKDGRSFAHETPSHTFVVCTCGGEDRLWVASYKKKPGNHEAIFIGERFGVHPIPRLPTFDTQTEAERACEAHYKKLRNPQ